MKIAEFDTLADEIFSELPAEVSHCTRPYLQSFGFHQFRTIMPELRDRLSTRVSEYDLSEWLNNSEQLGPYERQVLGDILFAPHRLVVIVGAPGSGKSSTLRYALQFFDANAKGDGTRPSSAPAAPRFDLYGAMRGTRPRHIYLDLNSRVTRIEQMATEGRPSAQLRKVFLQELPQTISQSILQLLGSVSRACGEPVASIFIELVKTSFAWALGDEPAPIGFGMKAEMLEVLTALGTIPSSTNPVDSRMRLLTQITELDIDKQIAFWFGLLEAISHLTCAHGTGPVARFFVVIDNVDPFPEYLQRVLVGMLMDHAQKVSFKVVVPVRFATFRTVTYARHFNWYPHSGPAPFDVVTLRLLTFLGGPSQFPAYQALPAEVRRRATCRAFELLLRLHRGHGAFRSLGRLMVHAAGESARRALEGTRFLFVSGSLDHHYDGVTAPDSELHALRTRYQFRLALLSLGATVREELDALSAEEGNTLATVAAAEDTATSLAVRIASSARSIFARITEFPAPPEVQEICKLEEVGRSAASDIRSGVDGVEQAMEGPELLEAFVKKLRNDVFATLTGAMKACSDLPQVCGDAIVALVCGALDRENLTPRVEDVDSDNEETGLFDEWDKSLYCRRLLSKNAPHATARVFVRSQFMVDLFHDAQKDNRLASGKARIIHWLANSDMGQKNVGDLIRQLLNYGFAKQSILGFFNDLLAPRLALLWVDHGFYYATFQELERLSETPATLTRAGWGYYFGVLDELDYVTETLHSARRPAHPKFTERLDLTLSELRDLHNIDVRLFQTRIAKLPEDISETERIDLITENALALCTAARVARDMLSRTTGHFHRVAAAQHPRGDALAHLSQMEELNQTRGLVVNWHNFLEAGSRQLGDVAVQNIQAPQDQGGIALLRARAIPAWRHKDHFMRGRLNHVGQAQKKLAEVLRGPALWRPEMIQDEFSPAAVSGVAE